MTIKKLFLSAFSVYSLCISSYPYSECAKVDDAVVAEAEHGEVQLWVGGAEVVSAGDPAHGNMSGRDTEHSYAEDTLHNP